MRFLLVLSALLAAFPGLAADDAKPVPAEAKPADMNPAESDLPSSKVAPEVRAVLEAFAKGDAGAAFKAATEGKEKGSAACGYLLGQMHEQGRGVPKADPAKAFALYEEAAKAGVSEAISAAARCLEGGIGTDKNPDKAFFYWQQAAEAGDPLAQGRLGQAEFEGTGRPVNLEAARTWIEKAAAGKDPLGLWLMSRMHEGGLAGLPVSQEKALEFCSKAAGAGHPRAMLRIGEYYASGRALPMDHVAAAGWYRLAAENGSADAMAVLALAYMEGRGVRASDRTAMEFAFAAARGGSGRGNYLAGRILDEGLGCTPDKVNALVYHLRASSLGIREAGTAVQRLQAALTPEQAKKAAELAVRRDAYPEPDSRRPGMQR